MWYFILKQFAKIQTQISFFDINLNGNIASTVLLSQKTIKPPPLAK